MVAIFSSVLVVVMLKKVVKYKDLTEEIYFKIDKEVNKLNEIFIYYKDDQDSFVLDLSLMKDYDRVSYFIVNNDFSSQEIFEQERNFFKQTGLEYMKIEHFNQFKFLYTKHLFHQIPFILNFNLNLGEFIWKHRKQLDIPTVQIPYYVNYFSYMFHQIKEKDFNVNSLILAIRGIENNYSYGYTVKLIVDIFKILAHMNIIHEKYY